MEDIRLITVNRKDIENPFGEDSVNLTSHLIKHPGLISEEAKFIQVELEIFDKKRQMTSTPLFVDLVFEDKNNIYPVEVKDDPSQVEMGKKQMLEYLQTFKEFLEIRGVDLKKHIVPVVAGISEL